MGKRGPQPTPTAVLAARGSWRAAARKGEPQPKIGVPECPSWISDIGREYWTEIAGMLAELGVMTEADRYPLALLVDALARYIAARDAVTTDGVLDQNKATYTTEGGAVCQHPAVGQMHKAWEQVLKLSREFGLTPASRAGITVGATSGEADGEKKDRLFRLG